MRINENRLKQIIREEARRVLSEQAAQDGGWNMNVGFEYDSITFTGEDRFGNTTGTVTAVVEINGVAHGDLSGKVEGKVRVPCEWHFGENGLVIEPPHIYDLEESDFSLALDGKPMSEIEDGLHHLYGTDFEPWFESTLGSEIEKAFDYNEDRVQSWIMDELQGRDEKYPDFD